ncbi:hypothetical protein ALC56_11073 [Trachymyrmex septentrionalis]|uniref:Uncharacterized protein n=1 Tax=Trachymyrmex septentrionalis TaxID=34720 RepID=A0A195F1Y2_9HYME|nr:hypothetical protein ALC56_11073 [Trachymyrmex septentrionalis]
MLTPRGRISKTYDTHVYAMHILVRHKYAISEAGESLMARAGTARSLPPKDFRQKINGDFEREGENLNSSSHEKQEIPDFIEAGTSCFIKTLIIRFTTMFYISDTECPTRTSCPEGPSSAIVSSDSRVGRRTLPRGRDDVAQSNSDGNDTTSKDISPGGRGNAKPALSAPYDRSPRDIFIPSDRKNERHLASSRNREIVKSLRTSPKRFLSTQFSFERRCQRDDCRDGAHRSGVPLTDGHQRFPQENNVYKNVDERYSVNMALALEAGTGDS